MTEPQRAGCPMQSSWRPPLFAGGCWLPLPELNRAGRSQSPMPCRSAKGRCGLRGAIRTRDLLLPRQADYQAFPRTVEKVGLPGGTRTPGLRVRSAALCPAELREDGAPSGIRTRVPALRGPRPRPLDDGSLHVGHVLRQVLVQGLDRLFELAEHVIPFGRVRLMLEQLLGAID